MKMDEQRYSRQIAFFGVEGQKALEETRVAIAGCGGLGSHVVQQLAYLGIRDFLLIDKEAIEKSNLNRSIGAKPSDVDQRRLKVDILKDLILSIRSDANVETLPASVVSAEAFQKLKSVEVLFGCVDKDGVRLILTHYSSLAAIPYFDLASDIIDKEELYGGRVMVALGGRSCLVCHLELDANEIHRQLASESELAIEDKIYGIDRRLLGESGPSVVSLNGIIASLGVTEFMLWKSGIRLPKAVIRYNGAKGIAVKEDVPAHEDCHYCKGLYGSRNYAI
jgi:molybdopterin-synthase adenylyltransferase